MEFSAIFHEINKKYCYAIEKGRFVIRLKTKKDDLEKVILHYQDKYIPTTFFDTRAFLVMEKIASDCWCDYYEAQIEMDMVCLRYFFELVDKEGQCAYYGNHDFFEEKITSIDYMYDCPQNLREEEMFLTPDWAKNKIVYQIFPSRYATSKDVPARKWYKTPITARDDLQGDLRGIINSLPHLKELGVDVVYMTPIFHSPSSHKYDTIDYYTIDPSFGTEADLCELVDKAHQMGMRVILDAVFNHTSPDFFAFADVKEKQEKSKYIDWYYIKGFPLKAKMGTKPNYKCFSYFGGMPKLNLQNEETVEYFLEVGRYWIEKCHIDGWRMDVGDEISHKFWRRFRKAMKAINPEVLIIGEVWHHAEDFLDGEEWDTVMNYPFYFAVDDLVAKEKITVSRFVGQLGYLEGNLHKRVYPILWNLLDSHDTSRFLNRCGENIEKFKLGVALQLLSPGMPFIYYGDEYGMTGGADPDCRRGMLWEEKRQNKEVYEWYCRLIHIRKEYPCLTEGKVIHTYCDDKEGLLSITREWQGKRLQLLVHAKAGTIVVPEDVIKSNDVVSAHNLIKNEMFCGKLGDYDIAVINQ